jgi:Fur family transcriptional regulator, ferric uptake regulator
MEGKDLRNAGLKVTLPRLKILEILEGDVVRHKSAEDIYKALLGSNEDIGLATVYRVLQGRRVRRRGHRRAAEGHRRAARL